METAAFVKITSLKNPIDLSEYLTANPQLNLIPMRDKFNANLLHHCAFNNLFENMKYYDTHSSVVTTRYDRAEQFRLNLSAWINQANHEGYLPVHYACLHGNVEMIKYLQELGGNLLYKSNIGQSLIHMAAQNNQVTPLIYLYNKGLKFDEGNKDGDTPLSVAAMKGSIQVVCFLVTLPQVNIDHANVNKQTPLIHAVKQNHHEVVKRLLIKGADRNLRNNQDKTAYQIAKQKNDRKLARILSEKRSCLDRIKIICNTKTVYKPEEPNLYLVFGFLFLFVTSTVPTNILIDLPLIDTIATGVFYAFYAVLYISLLFGPKKKQPVSIKQLQPPFCSECRTKKIPQSYHCFFCKTCIYRYDHHCPWINNCVGWHNMGRFTLFLFLTLIALLETTILTIYEGIISKRYRYKFDNSEMIFLIIHIWTLIVALFIYPLSTIMYQQLKTILLNRTAYERHRTPSKSNNKKQSLLDDSAQEDDEQEEEDCSFGNCCEICKPPLDQRVEQ